MHTYLKQWLSTLAPQRCLACDEIRVSHEAGFCEACEPLIDEAPLLMQVPAPSSALFVYGGPIKEGIKRMKYGSRSDIAYGFAQLISEHVNDYQGLIDAVVPVPLHINKLHRRGFNQSALMAKSLARALSVPLMSRALRRVRDTKDQASLTPDQRRANIKDAFRSSSNIESLRVLLVDDVRTTGITMFEAAKALREARAKDVLTLALAQRVIE